MNSQPIDTRAEWAALCLLERSKPPRPGGVSDRCVVLVTRPEVTAPMHSSRPARGDRARPPSTGRNARVRTTRSVVRPLARFTSKATVSPFASRRCASVVGWAEVPARVQICLARRSSFFFVALRAQQRRHSRRPQTAPQCHCVPERAIFLGGRRRGRAAGGTGAQ